MYQGSRFPGGSVGLAAISGIEQALWDVKGKALGVPCYQLLGGKCREKVRVYGHTSGAEEASQKIKKYGYTALKTGLHLGGEERVPWREAVRKSVEKLAEIREGVGLEVEIGVDAHATILEPIRALEMAEALKPHRPFFYEEPLRPENIDALARLRSQVSIPIATGEMLYTKFQFRELLFKEAADIIQPDICLCGGVLEMKKIAAIAESCYVTVAPHNPCSPVATAVNVHFAISTPNFLILEYIPDDQPPRRELVKEPVEMKDGYLMVPEKPGWGIELNEEALGKYPYRSWKRGFPRNEDGSLGLI
jgi:galactonate dehydratase